MKYWMKVTVLWVAVFTVLYFLVGTWYQALGALVLVGLGGAFTWAMTPEGVNEVEEMSKKL